MVAPMDVDSGPIEEAPEKLRPHRPSVKAKGHDTSQIHRAQTEKARKADRVISRMTSQGKDREEVLFQFMEGKRDDLHTMQEIDSAVLAKIAARLPEEEMPDVQTKIIGQIVGKRRQALQNICQNQHICGLYQALQGTPLPSQEALPQMPDNEISGLVFNLANYIKHWKALPDRLKQVYEPVDVRAIYDDPEQLEKIIEAVYSYRLIDLCKAAGLISGEPIFKSREEVLAKVREIASIPTNVLQEALKLQKTVVFNIMSRVRQLEVTVSPKLRGFFETMRAIGEKLQSSEPSDEQTSISVLSLFQKNCRNFQDQVDKFELLVIEEIQNELGVKHTIAEQIVREAQNNWKNFVEIRPDGIVKQTHSIKGLKIYMLPGTTQLVADYGKKVIGKGTFKRVKSLYRLGASEFVRLTRLKKERVKAFERDVKTELDARIVLSGVPNIASITTVSYYNKYDQLKTRYIMTRYEGDLFALIHDPKCKERALQICKGVMSSLIGVHNKGYVHGDLKSSNVLVQENQGYLCDFGLLNKENNPIPFTGNLIYMAPETVFKPEVVYNRKMDMFSLGILLLEVVAQGQYWKWSDHVKELQESLEEKMCSIRANMDKLTEDEWLQQEETLEKRTDSSYRKLLEELHSYLSKGTHPLFLLIKDLLSYNPEERPDAEQAQTRFLEGSTI